MYIVGRKVERERERGLWLLCGPGHFLQFHGSRVNIFASEYR